MGGEWLRLHQAEGYGARPAWMLAAGLQKREISVWQDADALQNLRAELERAGVAKAKAIEDEDFAQAKELKQRMAELEDQVKECEAAAANAASMQRLENLRQELAEAKAEKA